MESGLWLLDPDTHEEIFVTYSELEKDTRTQLIKPIGGFVFPADLFMQAELPTVPFYVKDWLPKRGKALIYAPAKSGKSFLSLQLARSVGVGEEFLGQPTSQGKVLLVQFELGEEIMRERLLSTGKTYENVFIGTSFSLKLDLAGGQSQLLAAMDAVEPDVLILDPIYKAIIGDENEATDMMEVLNFLDSLIEGYNCAIWIVHHSGKDPSKRGRGSSVFEDWVDSYLEVKRTSAKDEPLKIKVEPVFLRHAALPPVAIEAEMVNFEFELRAGAKSIKEQVLDAIQLAAEPVSPAELFAEKIGSNQGVYNALNKLIIDGKIEKVGWGKYACKPA